MILSWPRRQTRCFQHSSSYQVLLMNEKVIIAGGSGFIGSALCSFLTQHGYQVVVLTRNPNAGLSNSNVSFIRWDSRSQGEWTESLEDAAGVINLSGENIGTGRWTRGKKEKIMTSRVQSTKLLVEALNAAKIKPKKFIAGSAVGFYGSQGNEILTEISSPGDGFLAEVIKATENEARNITHDIQLIIIRTGIVLGCEGGIIPMLRRVFRYTGVTYFKVRNHWMSWIHLQDAIGAILHLLSSPDTQGIYNLTSPEPVKIRDFYKSISKAMNTIIWPAFPAFVAKAAMGEMANETLLSSQRIIPDRLLQDKYRFKYISCRDALNSILTS